MLSPELTERVLDKLGLVSRPQPDRGGLHEVYLAWCRRVPFDNIVKRIHLASGSAAGIPNGTPDAFFASWLAHGTGGTCWPGAGALHALLESLGFDARRGSAAMYDDRTGPIHTHGTTIVRVDGTDLWVDSSMLTNVPLPLIVDDSTRIDDPIGPVRSEPVEDLWRVWWTTVTAEEIGCLLLDDDASAAHFLARYEASRDMSPFNTALYATHNTDGARVSLLAGTRFERTADGIVAEPIGDDRERVLIEEFGYSDEIVAALPADEVTPAPNVEYR
jgi:N-hydroxyarylamine O-acetyltransferase